MADEKKNKNKPIFTSYVGTFKADSFSVDENGVASAVLETPGGDKVVKGHKTSNKDHAETLKNAVDTGGEQIIRGALLPGGKDGHYLAINSVGPEQIAGVVNNVQKSNFEPGSEKMAYVNAFVQVEKGEHKIGQPIKAFGDDAMALKDLKDGDRLEVPARFTHDLQTDKDGNEMTDADGKKQWNDFYLVTGPGKFEPGADKTAEADAPSP